MDVRVLLLALSLAACAPVIKEVGIDTAAELVVEGAETAVEAVEKPTQASVVSIPLTTPTEKPTWAAPATQPSVQVFAVANAYSSVPVAGPPLGIDTGATSCSAADPVCTQQSYQAADAYKPH